jgi:hypothetical protein
LNTKTVAYMALCNFQTCPISWSFTKVGDETCSWTIVNGRMFHFRSVCVKLNDGSWSYVIGAEYLSRYTSYCMTNCTLTCECLGYACECNEIEYCTFEYNVS